MEGASEAIHELLLDEDKGKSAEQEPLQSKSDKKSKKAKSVGEKEAEMAAASKEMKAEEKEATSDGSSIGSTVYSLVKKVAIVGGIYLVGYMGWSVAWLIG